MFSITKVGDEVSSREVREFIADLLSDVEKLPHISSRGTENAIYDDGLADPIHSGSTCFVIENSSVWMLGNDDVWREI